MPYFALMTDKPDSAKLRADTRAVHVEYLDARRDMLLAAGAMTEDDGTGGSGRIYIIDTDDRAEAERFVHGDPFYKVGLFSDVKITRWRKAFFNKVKLV